MPGKSSVNSPSALRRVRRLRNRLLTPPEQASLELLCQGLNDAETYSVQHGGFDQDLAMILHFQNGKTWRAKFGILHKAPGGVVLGFLVGGGEKGMNGGNLRSESLMTNLRELGIL